MRTPNTSCVLCSKPLYRRPSDLAKARYSACKQCRSEAQRVVGITDAQHKGLSKGRAKGTNHRPPGFKHREETKAKIGASNDSFWKHNPEKALLRGEKLRGENHYQWKGGISSLNQSIRQMNENRKWMDAVKQRDGFLCQHCGSDQEIESHHKIELSTLIDQYEIKTKDDARLAPLWDLDNGITLCRKCHYKEHGRKYED